MVEQETRETTQGIETHFARAIELLRAVDDCSQNDEPASEKTLEEIFEFLTDLYHNGIIGEPS